MPAEGAKRVEITFADLEHQAQTVQDWLRAHYRHLEPHAHEDDAGLTVGMTVPEDHFDEMTSWTARLLEATSSLDLALELLAHCFEELGLPPSSVASVRLG